MRRLASSILILLLCAAGIAAQAGAEEHAMTLTSQAFQAGGEIPKRYTCKGADVSPPLAWSGVPANAKSLVLIVDDPDAPDPAAPRMTWVHWVVYNIPPTAAGLPEGVAANALPAGTLQGVNDFQHTAYGGPCPPVGRHRYFHKLYALDTVLPDLHQPTKAALEKAMQGHVVAHTELLGMFRS
ncbi:YbhB/YbcL family Raf kinase inhibitor-like protein [Burkholderia sp. Bp8963]|nr:YbhB/YbcL family Raf kinase inhibitor-like protein [Burkholderia sp. Bp8963]